MTWKKKTAGPAAAEEKEMQGPAQTAENREKADGACGKRESLWRRKDLNRLVLCIVAMLLVCVASFPSKDAAYAQAAGAESAAAAQSASGRPAAPDGTYRSIGEFSKEGIIAAYERAGRSDLAALARQYPDGFLKKECLQLVEFASPEDMDREFKRWLKDRKEKKQLKGQT